MPKTKLPSSFKILSKQDFTTEISGNFLTVLSVKTLDYGITYTLSISSVPTDANMPISYFKVIVKFAQAPLEVTLSTVDEISTTVLTDESN